ncbi:GDSL esterase/lipase [Rhynchospora pubera]|uniref:GDSL esterase/lipase n=1 Tax=Rhynchospora pubera TaxID=906938 RepID=A0AAV8E8T7_9POAL|nr:GDSL esterase/lipase [Rhynchospora pubera]
MEKTKCTTPLFFPSIFLASILLLARETDASCNPKRGSYNKLFVFGDSFADTGNLGKLGREFTHCWYVPYGTTFPGKPTGRFSNGRVLTDFVASFMGVRSPVPYKSRKAGSKVVSYGMNFAVGGAGVFDTGNFQRNLSEQIDLLKQQIDCGVFSVCDLKMSVGMVAVSGNDYSYVASRKNSTEAAFDMIPSVVKQIKSDIERVLNLGVAKVIVTNLHPLGCTPYFTRGRNFTDCDVPANMGALVHNTALKQALSQLDRTQSSVLLLDLNSPFYDIVSQVKGPKKFNITRRPCCESFTPDNYCGEIDDSGNRKYNLCTNPDQYFYWDDVHPTQAGWAAVAKSFETTIRRFLYQ